MSAPTQLRDRHGRNILTHSAGGYSRGCRCEICTAGHAAYARDRRAAAGARRAAAQSDGGTYVVEGIRHGSAHGYREKGCRCASCYRAKKFGARPSVPAVVTCIRCRSTESTGICCSTHNAALCHRCYRRTHFVERCGAGCGRCEREGLDPMKWPTPVAAGGAS